MMIQSRNKYIYSGKCVNILNKSQMSIGLNDQTAGSL